MSLEKNPLVTIIIPCFNHERYIARAITSAQQQTYNNCEIIVIDNGSTDESCTIIDSYKYDDRIRTIRLGENKPPGSYGGAISQGLSIAKGKYISILYSDDYYLPEKISAQIKAFENAPHSVGVVYCHGYQARENKEARLVPWIMGSKSGFLFHEYLTKLPQVIPISPLVRRECYDFIGLNNPWTGSEYDWFVMSAYFDFKLVDRHLVVMQEHGKNDRFNFSSVFERNILFNDILFSNDAILQRSAGLHTRMLSKVYLIFARDFALIGDSRNCTKAIKLALTSRPMALLSLNAIILLCWAVLPGKVFVQLLKNAHKLRLLLRS